MVTSQTDKKLKQQIEEATKGLIIDTGLTNGTPANQINIDGKTFNLDFPKPSSGGGSPAVSEDQIFRNEQGRPSGITVNGKTFLGLNSNDVEKILSAEQKKLGGPLTQEFEKQSIAQQQQQQSQQLQGQVGQFQQLPISNAPLLDTGQAISQGIVGAIPRALSFAVTGAGIGLTSGAVAGAGVASPITAPAGATIGAVAGFVSGLASSIISEFKSQRTDTINAQKRVLSEGKQNLNDWATLAASDPANAAFYVNQYNLQLSQISQAYRQMKFDTQRDLAQFEKAIPDLAEFEAFYSIGGEKDALDLKMRFSLSNPSTTEYNMLELVNRRLKTE